MIARSSARRRLTGTAAVLIALGLALPAGGQAARPNTGKWDTNDWSKDLSFVVKGKKKLRIASFNANWRTNWTCSDGQEVWTQSSGLGARVTRGGAFNSTTTTMIGSLNRMLTVNLSGRFGSRTTASGTLTFSLAGCGTQVEQWGALGPRKHKPGWTPGNPNPGNPNPGPCIPVPLPDGSGFICA